MRLLLALSAVAASACQCFVAVEETGDTLEDGGFLWVDAGVMEPTVDLGQACRVPSECSALANPPPFCGRVAASCLNERCVYECPNQVSRACRARSGCLECGPDGGSCTTCDAPTCSFSITWNSKCPGLVFRDGARFEVKPPTGACRADLRIDGGVVGAWLGGVGAGSALLEIPSLGGACLAHSLGTGLPRSFVSCPGCSFVAVGCE